MQPSYLCVSIHVCTRVIQRVFVKFAFLPSFGSEKPFWYDAACPGELVCEVSLIETPLLSVAAGIKEQSFPCVPGIGFFPLSQRLHFQYWSCIWRGGPVQQMEVFHFDLFFLFKC